MYVQKIENKIHMLDIVWLVEVKLTNFSAVRKHIHLSTLPLQKSVTIQAMVWSSQSQSLVYRKGPNCFVHLKHNQ